MPTPEPRGRVADVALYALLLLVVWGLTAGSRGLWQDDTTHLGLAFTLQADGLQNWLQITQNKPLRRLSFAPFWLAVESGNPVIVLQLVCGAVWLGIALAAGWLCRLILPAKRLIALLAIVLTLTATADYLTNNLTALGYNQALLAFLLAVGCGLRFLQTGGAWRALASAALLAVSLFTYEPAIPALPVAALLFVLAARQQRRRLLSLAAAWAAVALPFAALEWSFLRDAQSYGGRMVAALPSSGLLPRALADWLLNFEPWQWAFNRPLFGERPPAVLSPWLMGSLAGLSALAVAVRLRRLPAEAPAPRSTLLLSSVFAATAMLCNFAYAGLSMANVHYRTHLASRIWASLALATACGWAASRWPRARAAVLAVPVAFVFFGAWGGLERQDLFTATWRRHHRELASILAAAPALQPGAEVILRSGATPAYLATEADYLTRSWLLLLYREPRIRSLRLTPERGTGCVSTAEGLDCWREGQAACFASRTCAGMHFDYERVVVMDFDDAGGTYRLLRSLAGDPLGAGAPPAALAAYRPQESIVKQPVSRWQRRLLLDP